MPATRPKAVEKAAVMLLLPLRLPLVACEPRCWPLCVQGVAAQGRKGLLGRHEQLGLRLETRTKTMLKTLSRNGSRTRSRLQKRRAN